MKTVEAKSKLIEIIKSSKVSWFVFDLDFGRAKPPEGKVYYPDAGVLYDYLVSELDSV